MDTSKIDLNKPAFGAGSQTLAELQANLTPDTSVEETVEIKSEEDTSEPSVEETKVPYSRFKNIHTRALEAEAEAEKWRLRAEEIENQRTSRAYEEPSSDMPSEWKELYGDSEASEKAWKLQQKREQAIEQRAYEAGQRGAMELESLQRERIDTNINVIDENFESLSAYVGRDLSEKEQSAILDIVDNYTPKDAHGNYQGAIMDFDKAWEIYELKQNSGKSQTRQSRDNVASLSGTNTQGDTSINTERDKSFNPLDWNAYKNRI
jgi:hypothetical protein